MRHGRVWSALALELPPPRMRHGRAHAKSSKERISEHIDPRAGLGLTDPTPTRTPKTKATPFCGTGTACPKAHMSG
eukprot:scaffold14475_cov107-Isochrysis_galbana.AAC.5